jgi:hypothetical protein
MKLYELDAQRRKEQVAKIFESHLGTRVDFDRLTPKQAHNMLQRVRSLVKEHRSSPSFHYSERNPDYMKLVMMEQGLVDVIKEMDMMGAAGKPGGIVAIDLKDPDKRQEIGIRLIENINDAFAKGLEFSDVKVKSKAGVATVSFKFPVAALALAKK